MKHSLTHVYDRRRQTTVSRFGLMSCACMQYAEVSGTVSSYDLNNSCFLKPASIPPVGGVTERGQFLPDPPQHHQSPQFS